MAAKRTGNPNGRPRVDIKEKEFDSLCAMQCTEEEIAAFYGCTIDTINNWCKRTFGQTFSEIYPQKRALGKASLRRAGFKMAQSVPSVHIFYAKNFLGMTDKIEQTVHEVEDLTTLAEMLSMPNKESEDENGTRVE